MKKVAILNRALPILIVSASALLGTLTALAQAPAPAGPPPVGAPPAGAPGRGGGGAGGVPNATAMQTALLQALSANLNTQNQQVTTARNALTTASLAPTMDAKDLQAKADAIGKADLALALARADAFQKIQASSDRFSKDQLTAVATQVSAGGRGGGGGGGTTPMNFNDHTGYVSLFDGTLNGWEGNTALWKIDDGAIFADTTTGSFGTTYLVRKDLTAKDFELKLLMKMGGSVNSGVQYRSWVMPMPLRNDGTKDIGGYQYDMDARNGFTGNLYEQHGRSTVTTAGEIVELQAPLVPGANAGRVKVATLSDNAKSFIKPLGEWNEVEIIAHGNVLTHIMNGHVLSITIDNNPSARSYDGVIALEVEAQGQAWAKDIWIKKFDDAPSRATAAAPTR